MAGVWDTPPTEAEKMGRRVGATSVGRRAPVSVFDSPPTPEEMGGSRPPLAAGGPSKAEALGRGAAQGATLGFGDEIGGAVQAGLGSVLPESYGGYPAEDRRSLDERYRAERDAARQDNEAAQRAHGGYYLGGQLAGGLTTAAGGAPTTLGGAVAAGAGLGAAAGLGGSQSDLTRGDVTGALKDSAVGGVIGAAGGAAGHAIAKTLPAAGKAIMDFGRGRLFKAAVGQSKKAYTQVNGRGLLEKAGEYLDEMGIGAGDSTESIAAKLRVRHDTLDSARDSMVSTLDQVAPPSDLISPQAVADKIEKDVAAPLKRVAANRDEYAQVMREVEAIRGLGDEPMSFAEASAQRRAVQQKINYDKKNGLDAAAEAKNKVAQIWNDEIDTKAAPLLSKLGKAEDAYKDLRHEYSLVKELMDHANDRVSGNAANRWASPSDYGIGAVGGVMSGNPFLGLAAAAANHVARRYGNAAAGRAAVNMARLLMSSPRGAEILAPSAARAAAASRPRPAYAHSNSQEIPPNAIARGYQ